LREDGGLEPGHESARDLQVNSNSNNNNNNNNNNNEDDDDEDDDEEDDEHVAADEDDDEDDDEGDCDDHRVTSDADRGGQRRSSLGERELGSAEMAALEDKWSRHQPATSDSSEEPAEGSPGTERLSGSEDDESYVYDDDSFYADDEEFEDLGDPGCRFPAIHGALPAVSREDSAARIIQLAMLRHSLSR